MKQNSNLLFILAIALAVLAGFGCTSSSSPAPAQTSSVAPETTPAAVIVPEAKAATVPAGKFTLKVVKVDSEETAGEDGKGANAVDGDSTTIWHTQWQDANPPCPHEIVIELIPPTMIKGFTYLPRQDDSDHGNIKDYEIYVSDDGIDFGQPAGKGTFENSKDLKTATFEPRKCRFIKLKALSEVNDSEWTSAAEIGVIPVE
jgi:hypothetical protein